MPPKIHKNVELDVPSGHDRTNSSDNVNSLLKYHKKFDLNSNYTYPELRLTGIDIFDKIDKLITKNTQNELLEDSFKYINKIFKKLFSPEARALIDMELMENFVDNIPSTRAEWSTCVEVIFPTTDYIS